MTRKAGPDPHAPLLRQVAGGDREAFRVLYDQTCERLTGYLHRLLRQDELVEDILVETYTAVWRCADRFRGQSRVITWMIGIARNLAFRALKQHRNHDCLDDHPELAAEGDRIAENDRRRLLMHVVQSLTAEQREILELAFYQDLPYREIGVLLGIPVNTVKTRVFHAKADQKKKFEIMGISHDDI